MKSVQEIAQAILIAASDVQTEVSHTGSEEVNLKVNEIRKQASDLALFCEAVGRIQATAKKDLAGLVKSMAELIMDESVLDDVGSMIRLGMTADLLNRRCSEYLTLDTKIGAGFDPRKQCGKAMSKRNTSEKVH